MHFIYFTKLEDFLKIEIAVCLEHRFTFTIAYVIACKE
jgi:hypothetical protein